MHAAGMKTLKEGNDKGMLIDELKLLCWLSVILLDVFEYPISPPAINTDNLQINFLLKASFSQKVVLFIYFFYVSFSAFFVRQLWLGY